MDREGRDPFPSFAALMTQKGSLATRRLVVNRLGIFVLLLGVVCAGTVWEGLEDFERLAVMIGVSAVFGASTCFLIANRLADGTVMTTE